MNRASPAGYVAGELYEELASMAAWLGLERVEATGRGDLGPALVALTN